MLESDVILAPATPPGVSALAVIRVSGVGSIGLVNMHFKGKKSLESMKGFTSAFGLFTTKEGNTIDEVILSVFRSPNSYTGEDMVEISCHGSGFIVEFIMRELVKSGARMANPGEFTKRAFLNGKMDLSQAEAVADLIHSDSALAHKSAIQHLRGGFSLQLASMRQQLIDFAALIELELDFSEEDVAFADRTQLLVLVKDILKILQALKDSFALGNAIKQGVAIAIAGKPNAGKSTLLNALLNEDKAIVSEIPGTTRDVIEDAITLEGVRFRFMDTAGLRETEDKIEAIGVERSKALIAKADIILYLVDLQNHNFDNLPEELKPLEKSSGKLILVGNKSDLADTERIQEFTAKFLNAKCVSAQSKIGLEDLKRELLSLVILDRTSDHETLVTNVRHFEQLTHTEEALQHVFTHLNSSTGGELLAMDIRQALYHLGLITGQVSNEEVLGSIFSRFCIGK